MMFDSKEEWADTPGFLRLYVEDGDAAFEQALEAGATAVTEMTNLFFGERVGHVRDPLRNIWCMNQRLEELDYEEISKRAVQKEYIEAMQYVQETFKLR